jgi:hypothetical protein
MVPAVGVLELAASTPVATHRDAGQYRLKNDPGEWGVASEVLGGSQRHLVLTVGCPCAPTRTASRRPPSITWPSSRALRTAVRGFVRGSSSEPRFVR